MLQHVLFSSPPHHEGLGSTSLHVMPSNLRPRAGIKAETAALTPSPGLHLFITATHEGVMLLRSKQQTPPGYRPHFQIEIWSHQMPATLNKHLSKLKQQPLQLGPRTQAADVVLTVPRKMMEVRLTRQSASRLQREGLERALHHKLTHQRALPTLC